jgi:hypothetical protein
MSTDLARVIIKTPWYKVLMKSFIIVLGVFLLVAHTMMVPALAQSTGQSTGQSRFLAGIEDMPLMAGLTEDTGSMLVFESSAGRYVEAFTNGVASPQAVQVFYDATLPQLGWKKTAPLTYQREGEILTLEILDGTPKAALDGTSNSAMVNVHFILSPIK